MIATSVFLLPNDTFFVELVAVAVILFLMTKYILPPLNKAMEARQEKIRESLEAADAAKAEAAAAGDERAALLNAARDQAREIVAAAQTTSDQVKGYHHGEEHDLQRRSPRQAPHGAGSSLASAWVLPVFLASAAEICG